MNKYLFLFTVTPVQSFISQARKSRDLFSGSKLLTELINQSIKLLPENSKVIFPSTNFNEKLDSKPNRFVAEFEAENSEEIKKIGELLTNNVSLMFNKIGEKAFKYIISGKKPKYFNKQLNEFLFPYWAAIELSDDNYSVEYKKLEATLGATKNIRAFNQTIEEAARKCSVCGERNALFYGNAKRKPTYYQKDALFGIKDLLPNEGLCAVCFTKRFYDSSSAGSFPSTAGISTMNVTSKIIKEKDYIEYKNLFGKNFDEQLLYKENLTPKYFEKQELDSNKLKDAKIIYSKIERLLKNKSLQDFVKYYALIMFDGDSMGRWLSGAYLKEGIKLKEFHSKLTESIGNFAMRANEILVEPKGRVVYAGGEDFLGFINLEYLFEVIRDLRVEYDKIINKSLQEFRKENASLTFSAGIVIAHYKMPLSSVLNWARRLEKSAKELNDDKNAFSLAVLKHSGEIHKTEFHWGDNEYITGNWDFIEFTTNQLLRENFSRIFIKNLVSEFIKLTHYVEKGDLKILELLKVETQRLLGRSLNKKNFETKDKANKTLLLFVEQINTVIDRITKKENILNFFYALEIADFISRKVKGGE